MEDRPLIIQTDRTLLLEVDSPSFAECRSSISPFSELERSPEHIHTYSVSSISIWNAVGAGIDADQIIKTLQRWTKFSIPSSVIDYIRSTASRFGKIEMTEGPDQSIRLSVKDSLVFHELVANKRISAMIRFIDSDTQSFLIDALQRGNIKVALIKLGYPVNDLVPFRIQEHFPVKLKPSLKLRDYQILAADAITGNGKPGTGYGTLVLPCGAGKTVVGLAIMASICTPTLIICPNIIAARQWIAEILDKTEIPASDIGEYSGEHKDIRSITVCTYQVLIHSSNALEMNNLELMNGRNWGLLIFDEVHLLPAPMFRFTASLQSAHRVGMTATLIREDGLESDVFSLIGPKRYDVPWSVLEQQGWIAEAICTEIRVPIPQELAIPYAVGTRFEKNRIASTNPAKLPVVMQLIAEHQGEFILVIGHYLDQLRKIGEKVNAPIITGSMPNKEREKHFSDFRSGKINILIVSRVANYAIDLPDASVAIQVSGVFGSRQEEAQRLGRILRPKERKSSFYTIVSKFTVEEEFAANRQKFLVEQGYSYRTEER
ncbi:MAG: helicase-associated domain-containing protein [Sphaerochaetaceae bacterium]|nr:helicase-associated domain-containing protein [Sphaerochaetaceae bacterium]MDD3163306.1 helicase-associated domain-containing protein [Sphaerochaetaceae bacterium]MDD4007292.1 helicase-associated domain-containing protein [Sphaerochaetaceae bacterium]MDD4396409.1 helicase-associated domain-containing protein [Sphaerochaetaceae bacterium]